MLRASGRRTLASAREGEDISDSHATGYNTGTVAAGEIQLAYGRWSAGADPIVGVHGLTASHMNFIGIAERLAGRRSVWAPDLRGRGASDKPKGPYGMDQHADDLLAAMRTAGIARAVVVGHSMGAYIGAAMAARAPEMVTSLVMLDGGYLLDVPPGLDIDQLLDALLRPQMERLRTTFPSRAAYLEQWRSLPAIPPQAWGPWVEAYLDYDLGGEAPELRPRPLEAAVREDFRSMADKPAAQRRLRAITCPVMVIRAEDGVAPGEPPIIPDQVMKEIRQCLPEVEEHLLPGTTHYTIALAEPGVSQVADLIESFTVRCLEMAAVQVEPNSGGRKAK